MPVRGWYRKYLKNNLFLKINLLFAVITIITIIVFSYFMYHYMSQSMLQKQLDIQNRAVESVGNYIGDKYDDVQSMMVDVYRDSELSFNMSYLLENSYQSYVEYRLDKFYNESRSSADVVEFFRNKLEDEPDIRSLMLYSAEQYLYAFDEYKQFKVISTNAVRSYIPDAMYLDGTSRISYPNIWVRKAIEQSDTPLYAIQAPINNKQSLRNIGQLLVYFDAEKLWTSLNKYKEDLMGTIIVLSAEGKVLFDTSNTYYGEIYPNLEQINQITDDRADNQDVIITKLTDSRGGFTVLSELPKEELGASYQSLRNMIWTISSICVLFAIMIPALVIKKFARRTDNIIRFTQKVKQGDLTARIEDAQEDELGQISKSFNEMLDDLNQYIDRVYKAEIKQKHTELAALEARVNPHFLYNTLEVIRMRAISQGAGDVGEMIYSLSVLFKGYVKQKPRYTMKDELEACRLYLELFRIRYKDRLSYSITCEEALKDKLIPKMSLQPVIENYILHGMRTDQKDNHIVIKVRLDGENIRMEALDNGKGISAERIAEINRGLEEPSAEMESFGLRSIHERLRLLYGKPFGIKLQSKLGEGTKVIVCLPISEEA